MGGCLFWVKQVPVPVYDKKGQMLSHLPFASIRSIRRTPEHGDRYLFHGWLLILGETGTCPHVRFAAAPSVLTQAAAFRLRVCL